MVVEARETPERKFIASFQEERMGQETTEIGGDGGSGRVMMAAGMDGSSGRVVGWLVGSW